jgi:hypothetical protein
MRMLTSMMVCSLCLGAAFAEPVVLDSGETLDVTSARIDGTNVILQHPILGTLTVPIDKVRSIDGAPPVKQTPPAEPAKPPAPVKTTPKENKATDTGAAEESPSEWKGTFTLSGSFNEGTAQNASLFTKLEFKRETTLEKTKLSTFYRFASDSGETNQSWFNVTANQLWNLPDSTWSLFADGQLDWSEFNSWQQRISGHGGLQIPLLALDKTQTPELWVDNLKLHGRVGVGPRKEFSGADTELVVEGDLGAGLTMDIAKGNALEANASFYPALNELGVYRINADLNWKIKLEGMDNLSLSLGLTYQYQSEVSSNDKNYDLLGTVGVALDF